MSKKEEKKEKEVVDAKSSEAKDNSENDENNNIEISNDVIAVIAGMAASDVPGVAEMAGGFAGGISEVLSGKRNKAKGIKVDVDGNKVVIDVNIIVEYGTRIPDVAFEIQKRVKKAVESMILTEQEVENKKKESKKEEKKKEKEAAKEQANKEEKKEEQK